MDDERAQRDTLQAAVAAALSALLGDVATGLAALVTRAGRRGTVTPTGRAAILTWLDATIARLFGVSPAAAAAAYATRGTIPQLLAASTRAAVLVAAPTGGVPGAVDPVRAWRDPNGLILSDRVWLAGEDARSRLTAVLDAGLARGATPDELAGELRRFVRPDVAGRTVRGDEAFSSARRLVDHEVNRVHGIATVASARGSGDLIAWTVAGRHPVKDECDLRARGGPYAPGAVPHHPQHVGCRCVLSRVPGGGTVEAGGVDGPGLIAALTGL